jgi:parvulin-like peptidyl-prolyl isomerase
MMKELGEECLLRYGQEVLEVEITHLLLEQALRESKLAVTDADLNAEITHAARLAGVVDKQNNPDLDQWYRLVTQEQDVSKELYLRDSVWPSATLKKLVGGSVEITQDDLQKGFEANYGQRVRCRAIVLHNMRKAQEVWAKARQNESLEYFCDLAAEYSIEPTSSTLRGEVPPIRQHGGQPQLEEAAFKLQAGQMSGIIQLGDRFVILKCEGRTDPVDVKFEDVREILLQDIHEKKLRVVMADKYEEIRSRARIDNYLAGTSQSPDKVPVADGPPRFDAAVRPTAGASTR